MRTPAVLFTTLLLTTLAFCQSDVGYTSKAGFVPDSRTAIAIAEAVLIPVYGKQQVENERPFTATLQDGAWNVTGTLRCPDARGGVTTQCEGGVATVKISKRDARIVYMMHGK